MMISILIFLIAATSASPFSAITAPSQENLTNSAYRLPNTTIPSKYYIYLELPENTLKGLNNTFRGSVIIQLKVLEPTHTILIHSGVNILGISLKDGLNNIIPVLNHTKNETTEIIMIKFKYPLFPSMDYNLKIVYFGNISTDRIRGISRIPYDVNGSKEYLIVTQFQAVSARLAFPCFDEPFYKAKFYLSIANPKEYTARSNTPTFRTINRGNSKITLFQETPKMSTYLLAWSVSKLLCTNPVEAKDDVPVRVCTRNKFLNYTKPAEEYGARIISAMSTWTNVSYTVGNSKMDEFVLPGITSLAMENWGLTVFHEYGIIWDELNTSNELKQGIIELISHEFAHQWFGNLVTTKWWDTLFLNEGLGTFFQYYMFELLKLNQYQMDKQFIIKEHQAALTLDGYDDSSELSSTVLTSDDIVNKFSAISYSKGASIFKMIMNVIGLDSFQKGLREYIKNNIFQSVTPYQLWDSLTKYANKDSLPEGVSFIDFMNHWINKPGFPLINVTSNGDDVILSQKRFLYNGTSDDQWFVPITYITSTNKTSRTVWLKPNSTVTLKNVVGNNAWIIINHNSRGYYRVHYDKILTEVLRADPLQFTDLDRTEIVDDTLSLALANQIPYSEAFETIKFLKNETSYYPWFVAISRFREITDKFEDDSEIVQHLNNILLLPLIKNISGNISRTNWAQVDHVTGLKLPLVWEAACRAGQKSCKNEVRKIFQKLRSSNLSINPNLRQVVYCNALRYSDDPTDWDFLWNLLGNIDQSHEKIYIYNGLGCTRNKDLLTGYLRASLDASPFELEIVWDSVYKSSSVGLEAAFDFFVNNYMYILKRYSSASNILVNIILRLTRDTQITKLQNFINELSEDSEFRSVAKTLLSSVKKNVKQQTRVKSELEKYLSIAPKIETAK